MYTVGECHTQLQTSSVVDAVVPMGEARGLKPPLHLYFFELCGCIKCCPAGSAAVH